MIDKRDARMRDLGATGRPGRITDVTVPVLGGRGAGGVLALMSAVLLFLALVVGVVTLGVLVSGPDTLDVAAMTGAVLTFAAYGDVRLALGARRRRATSLWPWIIAGAGFVLLFARPLAVPAVLGLHLALSLALLCGRLSAGRYEPRPWLIRHLRARRCPFCMYPKPAGDRRSACSECGRTVRYGVRGRWRGEAGG